MQKKNTQEWKHVFEKRGNLFGHEKVLAQDKGGEKHFLFREKGWSKEHILKKERAYQKNTFFCFLFFSGFFFCQKNKEVKQNSWWNMRELIEEEGEFKKYVMFLLKTIFFFCKKIDTKRND